jgi:hypothetical protein
VDEGALGGAPNINNYTLIKEALIQHSRQKRKQMGAATVAAKKKRHKLALNSQQQ